MLFVNHVHQKSMILILLQGKIMNRIWSETERDYIRENAGKLKDKELAAKLTQITGRVISLQAVRKQRQKLGIAKAPGRGKCDLAEDNQPVLVTNDQN